MKWFKFSFISGLVLGAFCNTLHAQLNGVYAIPGNFPSLAAAITTLNTQGISGAVTINIASGYTETVSNGGYSIYPTPGASFLNTITFKAQGAGNAPLFIAGTGSAVPSSNAQDGILKLIGADYFSFDGLAFTDLNTTNPQTMEFGIGFFKLSTTDGCQSNTVKNCTITLNRINNANAAGIVYPGSRGIELVNAQSGAHLTALAVLAASGSNSNNRFYNNTIQNCNIGITCIGYAALSPYNLADFGNDIGGTLSANGNHILNFGGASGATNASYGIIAINQYNFNASYNRINNNTGLGFNHPVTLRGIYLSGATNANVTVSNNTLTLAFNGSSGQVSAIENNSGVTGISNLVQIQNNCIENCVNPLAVNATFLGIYNTANSASLNISFNRIQNNSTSGYGGNTYLIVSSAGVSSLVTISNNTVGFAFNGVSSYTATHYGIYNNATTSTGSVVIQNNIYNALQYSATATGPTYVFLNSGIPARVLMSGNLIDNLNINSSGTFVGYYNNASTQSVSVVQSNTISNITYASSNGTFYGYLGNGNVPASSTHSIIQNVIANITSTIAGSNAIYLLYSNENSGIPYPLKTISSNSISNIQFNSNGVMYPLIMNYLGDGNQNTSSIINDNYIQNIRNNTSIYGMQVSANTSPSYPVMVSTNTITGLYTNLNGASILGTYLLSGSASSGLHFFRNRIYNLNVNGAASTIYGLYTGATSTTNIYNNLISQLSATAAAGLNRINGIYVASGNAVNMWYNSILLNGTSSGINFGTNALYVNTAASVQLINNILVNNCNPTGTGISCAYRRSNANLSTYQLNSNSNVFYAGVPAANRVLYSDGLINLQTLTATQSTLNPRDLQSVTENPNFISVLGANANFLNINPLIPTQIESGATALANVTNDCILTVRNPSSPDIGAWEGNFTALTTCSGTPVGGTAVISTSVGCPSIQFSLQVLGNSSGAGISYQWQSSNSALGPWNSINGALSSLISSSVNTTTYFRLMVTCANSSLSAYSSVVSYSVNNPGPCICNAYQSSAAALNTDEDILEVSISNLNVISTCTTTAPGVGSIPNQYSNYAGVVNAASLIAGQNYNFTVQVGTCGGAFPNAIACYIDFNQNASFNDPGEQVYLSPASTNGPHLETGTITIPANASVGITRMRWILNETPTPAVITATGSYALGETEDFCAQLLPPLCNGTISAGQSALSNSLACANTSLTLSASGVSSLSGIGFQWYNASSLAGPWIPIAGATSSVYTVLTGTTGYYQLVSTCTVSAFSATTAPVSYSAISVPLTLSPQSSSICTGSSLSLTANGATSYSWSTGGTSSVIVVSPVLTTQYTVTGITGPCSATAQTQVLVQATPSLSVNSQTVCTGGTATLSVSGANTYSWSTGSSNSFIVVSPSVSTVYTVSGTSNGCSDTQTLSVSVISPPSLTASAISSLICQGSSATLQVSGAGNYTWSSGATGSTAVVSPSTTTMYSVTGSSGLCGSTATVLVQVQAAPVLSVSSASICSGTSASLSVSGASTYSWSTGGTSSVIVVSPVFTTQYTVTGITGPCSATAQTQVLVQATPSLSVNSQTVCTGGTATLSVSGANTYSWSTGSSNSFIVVSPSVSTVYTVSGTSNGCSDTQTLSVSVISPPSLTASAISSLICQGSSATLQVSGAGNYTWSSGATGSTAVVSPSTTTMYSVTGSSGLCGSTATVLVQVQAAPVLSVSSASICSGTSASLSVSGASTYSWSTGGTSSVIVVSPVFTTQYTVTGITGPCSATAQTQVLVQATPSLSVNSQTVCPGGTATLSVSGANTYSWSTGSSNSFIVVSPSVSTVYTVSGTSNGCSDTQTLSVSMGSSLSLLASASPSVVCPGGTATLNVSGALSYTWNTGATGSVLVISPTATAVYTVYGFNAGCSGTTALSMSVVPVPSISINASVPGTVCAGAQLSLSATGAGTYSWSTGATGSLLVVSPTVSTVYSVTGSNGACSSTQSIAITVGSGSLSLVVLANPSTICAGASATLNASGAGSYTWNTGQTGPLITVSPSLSTVYTVTAQNGACSGSATLAVQVNAAAPVQVSAWPSDSICSGRQATLSALGSYSVYTWSSSAGTGSQVVVSPSTAVVYTVFASGAPGGCSTSASIALYVLSNPVSVLSITNSGCGTVCTGSIQASTSLGHSPYTYSLSGTTCSTMPCTGLCTGLYTLQTTDSMGCRSNNIFSIAQTNNITGVISSTHATCAQCNDGQLQVNSLSGTAPYTYTWIPSGGNLNTASNLKPGCYTVQVQDAGACKTTLNACIGIRTGIEGELIMPDALLVYPNPAHNWFYAEYPDKNLYITLYDALGRLVVQSQTAYQKAGIDLHHLAKGLYQAHVYIQGVQLVKKIIVE